MGIVFTLRSAKGGGRLKIVELLLKEEGYFEDFIVFKPAEKMNPDININSQSESQANATSEPSAKRKREGPFRGPSRAMKYKKLRQAQPGKVKVEIPSSLGAPVGDRALQFVGECSDWVKEICPLNVNKWSDMTPSILDELYGKIKERSEKNRANAYSKKIQSACGAKSTARIIHEMEIEAEASLEAENADSSKGNPSSSTAPNQAQADIEPAYVKLWRKAKQHKDGTFDDEGEIKLNEFKRLHEKEIQEKGVDNLSIDEAYMKVLGYCSGYARGQGK